MNRKQRPASAMHRGNGEKPKHGRRTLRRLASLLSPYRGRLVLAVFVAVGSVFASSLSPKFLGDVTTAIYEGARTQFSWSRIIHLLILLALAYIMGSLLQYVLNLTMVSVSQRVVFSLRNDIMEKLDRLPLRYYDGHGRGDIMSRVTNDVDVISQSLQEGLVRIVSSLLTVVIVFAMMVSIDLWMTIAGLVVLPLSLFFARMVVKRSQPHFVGVQRNLGTLNAHIEEMYGGHDVVQAFGNEVKSLEDFDSVNDRLYEDNWKSKFLSSIMMPLVGFAGNIGYVAVVVLGAILAASKAITIGEIQAFIQYMRRFNRPVSEAANIANVFQSTLAAAERVFELLDEEEERPDTVSSLPLDPSQHGRVSFRHIRFGYEEGRTVIEDLDVDIPAGTKVAIVGPTGSGKTTLINLLMRFYDVDDGAVLVDGIDIRDMGRDDLRSRFGMVLQDTWLFDGTIAENIAYGSGRIDLPRKRVEEAARLACADHFIRTLPKGYDMPVADGGENLSQGERQLLTIARAMVGEPRFLILDEATSNVDTRTELSIQKGIRNLLEGRTGFVIAHRLSTIRDADLILVLDHGRLVEQGTHETLLAANGFYAGLYNSQFATGNPL